MNNKLPVQIENLELPHDNFEYLDDRVTTVANNLVSTSTSIYSMFG